MNVREFKKQSARLPTLHDIKIARILLNEGALDDDSAEIMTCVTCGRIGTRYGPKCAMDVAPLDCAFSDVES